MKCSLNKIIILILFIFLVTGCRKKNRPPHTPYTPTGPSTGTIDYNYNFSSVAIDPDGDSISMRFDWGDGNTTLTDYYSSEEIISNSYKWAQEGTFNIKVKSQDEYGVWSDWSDPLAVSMPNNKLVITLEFQEIINNLFQRISTIFSNIFLKKLG